MFDILLLNDNIGHSKILIYLLAKCWETINVFDFKMKKCINVKFDTALVFVLLFLYQNKQATENSQSQVQIYISTNR